MIQKANNKSFYFQTFVIRKLDIKDLYMNFIILNLFQHKSEKAFYCYQFCGMQ